VIRSRLAEAAALESQPTPRPAEVKPAALAGGGSASGPKLSLDARALALFLDHTDWTKKKIADALGCHEKSLSPRRCPRLTAAIAAHKSPIDPDRPRPRGSKDSEGNLEAWTEADE
jgi:hypothetical protein